MTKIFDDGNMWIESHQIVATSIGIGGTKTTDVTLDKPGRYVGASGYSKGNTSNNVGGIQIANTDNTQLTYGQAVSAIRIRTFNASGASNVIEQWLMVFLKK